jgi:hypothetical protein
MKSGQIEKYLYIVSLNLQFTPRRIRITKYPGPALSNSPLPHVGTPKIIFHIPMRINTQEKGMKTKNDGVANIFYSNIANCWTKIPAIIPGAFGIIFGMLEFICSSICRGTPNDIL